MTAAAPAIQDNRLRRDGGIGFLISRVRGNQARVRMEIKWPTLIGGIARRRSISKSAADFDADGPILGSARDGRRYPKFVGAGHSDRLVQCPLRRLVFADGHGKLRGEMVPVIAM
jgi:hypothetical protein